MLRLLGIRHHGPGSTKAMLKALVANPPDVIVIEAPADGEGLLEFVSMSAGSRQSGQSSTQFTESLAEENHPSIPNILIPPISALIYNPKDIRQAIYLPFTEFSPEWQAILFARKHNIPIRFMDLPMSISFALDEKEKNIIQRKMEVEEKWTDEEIRFRKDPMGFLAHLAGYTDSERWWEVMFESPDNETDIFVAIEEMTTELREFKEETPRTQQREAFMRQTLRKVQKEGFGNIAVVCGAWHVPALTDLKKYKVSHDAALLKGIKKIRTTATWIPWSYDRMTFDSGYGSGVISPAWYELLFSQKDQAALRWMINVARLFRKEDLDASSAHVIEAIRLAETLAAMRGLSVPGIDELKEAAVTTICEGSAEKLELIEQQLITGKKVGHVPDSVPTVPLQSDILKTIKSARMREYWENTEEQWLKGVDKDGRPNGIELRKDIDLMKSHLLHRLLLLDIPWGSLVDLDRYQTAGVQKEYWKMQWAPEFAIRIIEMGAWGNTVEEACLKFLRKKTDETDALPALTALVKKSLNADLPAAFDHLLKKLEDLAALATDVYHLMDALPPLVQIVKYGNTRGTDVSTVEKVVQHLVPRICIGLPGAVTNLDEESSEDAFKRIQNVHRAIGLLDVASFNQQWHQALARIAAAKQVNGLITGGCTRILLDKKIISETEGAARMRYALSRSVAPLPAAQWLEGFLVGSGTVLLHNHVLWNLLDEWISELNEENFSEVLAVLRRTFSKFTPPERQRMMSLAKQGQVELKEKVIDFEEERGALVLPTVRALLGLINDQRINEF
ncbi:MAG: DUF5682 family protein [Bacteroidota bacterium]